MVCMYIRMHIFNAGLGTGDLISYMRLRFTYKNHRDTSGVLLWQGHFVVIPGPVEHRFDVILGPLVCCPWGSFWAHSEAILLALAPDGLKGPCWAPLGAPR